MRLNRLAAAAGGDRTRDMARPHPSTATRTSWLYALLACLVLTAPAAASPKHLRLDDSGRVQSGVASYYRPSRVHRKTASGARLKSNEMTAASRTLPLGTRAKVTNTRNGRSAEVTITDRGPFTGHRILDVSPKAAMRLGMTSSGVAKVTVTPLHPSKGTVRIARR
jgi:rare lipoprotein A